ncbi:MAG: tetratricopeptide repeat protein [Alphaproteobacteria bacterium]|nr:MAG: tetratricopeptide repeat protein [Alphaproteobacteria bacterium]
MSKARARERKKARLAKRPAATVAPRDVHDSDSQQLKLATNGASPSQSQLNRLLEHYQSGRYGDAEKSAISITEQFPHHQFSWKVLGAVFQETGRISESVVVSQKSVELAPQDAEAHNNLGNTLKDLGRLEEAEASFRQAIALKPDFAEAHSHLAFTLVAKGLTESALEHFKRNLDLERGQNPVNPHHKSFRLISKAKIDHDIEQFEYLAASGYETERFHELATRYKKISSEINWPLDTETLPLSDQHLNVLGDTYNRPIHILEAPALGEFSLGDNLDVNKITEDYFEHEFGLTYFDDFLSPTALKSLQEFLLGSTIWFDFFHTGGYMGAYLKDGLASPLILQIAEDLRKSFPKIFKNHPLIQLWAYKYDSRACDKNNSYTGINVHADAAAINVNFWITPKSANLDPSSGGLVVYNAVAPLVWNFDAYNGNEKKAREELQNSSQKKTIVPYNENRVVLFNSSLWHETDKIEFKEGYENRRINLTMLFGRREL